MSAEISQLFRFAVIGVLVAAIYVVGFTALEQMGTTALVANLVAFAVAVAFQYVGQTLWTFRRELGDRQQGARFATTIGLGVVYSSALTSLVGPALGWRPWVSAAIVAVTLPVINYISFRLWVYGAENIQGKE